ncbi:glycogen debranching N-terminal domain-containing protein [Geobacillus sp. CAMR5420]|uniref:glycogen debranching N-terminal domain-containing protein n=1 Tax=Geobacillus thermoleovorans TaxID=33941 RepID=UPI0009DE8385
MDYRVIKENDLFLLTDQEGNVPTIRTGLAYIRKDTRFLSKWDLRINGEKFGHLARYSGFVV